MWTPTSTRPSGSARTCSASSTSVHPTGSMLQHMGQVHLHNLICMRLQCIIRVCASHWPNAAAHGAGTLARLEDDEDDEERYLRKPFFRKNILTKVSHCKNAICKGCFTRVLNKGNPMSNVNLISFHLNFLASGQGPLCVREQGLNEIKSVPHLG